ncbi:hypothetical protein B0H63DRAFT_561493 [Podospora didyma]|uniref:Protein kinase domain-containing protein n=1 Tax=Podospora didyma TaxID=330526 RepID=A0AAE0TWA0_9PEZI|nr:hypothetical protein B0H63DRAFT_561493 [Podospora didyma]
MASKLAPTPSQTFFTLISLNKKAQDILALNPGYAGFVETSPDIKVRCLKFTTTQKSITPGLLVSFGTHEPSDIRLPDVGGFKTKHCAIYLAPSGELVLLNVTGSKDLVTIKNEPNSEKDHLYPIPNTARRQRVLPRVLRNTTVSIGQDPDAATFDLRWDPRFVEENLSSLESPLVQRNLAALSRHLGVTTAQPYFRIRNHDQREQTNIYKPFLGPEYSRLPNVIRHLHYYRRLCYRYYSAVWKAVDLMTGELWVVKELIENSEIGRQWFKKEMETAFKLNRYLPAAVVGLEAEPKPRLIRYEGYQGFLPGGKFLIFYELFDGLVSDLPTKTKHTYTIEDKSGCLGDCVDPDMGIPRWAPRLVRDVIEAIEFMENSDEKRFHPNFHSPANMVYKAKLVPSKDPRCPGKLEPEYKFLIADLSEVFRAEEGGTSLQQISRSRAPEFCQPASKISPASSIWSVGILIGTVTGIFCWEERDMKSQDWLEKRANLGSTNIEYNEPRDKYLRWGYRISSLAASGCLPPILSLMLDMDPSKRITAAKCKENLRTPQALMTGFLQVPRGLVTTSKRRPTTTTNVPQTAVFPASRGKTPPKSTEKTPPPVRQSPSKQKANTPPRSKTADTKLGPRERNASPETKTPNPAVKSKPDPKEALPKVNIEPKTPTKRKTSKDASTLNVDDSKRRQED